ncbi:Heterochromatin protein 1 [Toxocara canis]|uniref:Heterochromatin protein 1 n=2 Tax=Toxocara canis TaxID=6265 RepID=A0A0B2VAE5_TOXCA|nr:Heterochromatin protein 1 [Toxocara canis]VDM45757.1 unnamed protein product [Toxocara canis]
MEESDGHTSEVNDEGDEEEFVVERVLAERYNPAKKCMEYLLKWQGYGDEDNTWEPEDNLECVALIEEFRKRAKNGDCATADPARPKASTSLPKKASGLVHITETNVESQSLKQRLRQSSSPALSSCTPEISDAESTSSESEDEASERVKRCYPSAGETGMEKGWLPEVIITAHAAESNFPASFVVKYQHKKKFERVPQEICKRMWPQLVIAFYERLVNNSVGGEYL